MTALTTLQSKIGVTPDGDFGPKTLKAATAYFKLSKERAAHFFGQCSHETGHFSLFEENLNYSAEGLTNTFGKYFPTISSTTGYARNPQKIANKVYANRMGNGSEASGDGWKYRGRGAIQLTGKDNYKLFSDSMKRPDIITNPSIVSEELAFESALFFFNRNKLWTICDGGVNDTQIKALTYRINGGYNGLQDRAIVTKKLYSML